VNAQMVYKDRLAGAIHAVELLFVEESFSDIGNP
jgi:hypothetical protein